MLLERAVLRVLLCAATHSRVLAGGWLNVATCLPCACWLMSTRLEELAEVHGRAKPGRPRVLILAPTAELAQQVRFSAFLLSPVYLQTLERGMLDVFRSNASTPYWL